jgi:hypothetical protein
VLGPALRKLAFAWPDGVSPRALADEVARLDDDFIAYPVGGLGPAAVPLISPGGAPSHDFAIAGPAASTAALARSPRLAALIGALGVRVARSRLSRLAGHTAATPAREWGYHWYRHQPIVLAIATDPAVRVVCGADAVHLAAGDAWLIDTSRPHAVDNRSPRACVHLIVETTDAASDPPRLPADGALAIAAYRFTVLTPDEIAQLVADIVGDAPDLPAAARLALRSLVARWTAVFARLGHDSKGELAYQDLVLDVRERVVPYLAPDSPAARAAAVIDTMLHVGPPALRRLSRAAAAARRPSPGPIEPPAFDRPLFVVSAPRVGSTLLFELLTRLPGAFTLGGENHEILRALPALHPAARGFASDRLTAADATPDVIAAVREGFARRLVDRDGRRFADRPRADRPRALRLIEKTPANALRIPFLRAVFPDARFVHLTREPRGNITSLVEGWRSRHFIAYRDLPGWPHRDWSFLLIPGWRALADRSLIEIASQQWQIANATIAHDLRDVDATAKYTADYDDLVCAPARVVREIAALIDLPPASTLDASLPLSRTVLSAPASHKWWRHEAELAAVLTSATPDTVTHRP